MPSNNFTQQQRSALLQALGIGRSNAIGAKRLASTLGFPTSGNQVLLRTLIKECIEIDNDLIGSATSNPAGFFIISTLQELETYIDTLEGRTKSNNIRRTALINSWNNSGNSNTNRTILTVI